MVLPPQIQTNLPPAIYERWNALLHSGESKRNFQAVSEVTIATLLGNSGWKLRNPPTPGHCLQFQNDNDERVDVIVLALTNGAAKKPNEDQLQHLLRVIARIQTQRRFGIAIHRWSPHDFDPDPIRRAVDLWLESVENGQWPGRYAQYDDEHLSLEFGLTDDEGTKNDSNIIYALGPFDGLRTMEVIESRILLELDKWERAPRGQDHLPTSVAVACVSDGPLCLGRTQLRSFMYGKPNALAMEGAPMQFSIDLPPNPESGLFRKDAYPFVAGLLMMEMGADHTLPDTQTRMYLNPWNAGPLHTAPLPIPTLHVRKWNDDAPRMTWVQPAVTNAVETEPPM